MGFSPFRKTGLVHHESEKSSNGYTLFAPVNHGVTYLVDMAGAVVHTWQSPIADRTFFFGELLENGNLLALLMPTRDQKPGGGDALVELDWQGRIVWEYRDPWLHHAFHRRKNGNTIVLHWKPVPEEIASRVRAIRDATRPPHKSEAMYGDALREIDPQGRTVWEWAASDALDPEQDRACRLHRFEEWSHCNSVQERPDGNLLLCFRDIDTVAILDRQSGRFLWKWGSDLLGHPHDSTLLDNGNVLVFDNGWHQLGRLDSSLVEVDPRTSSVVWKYVGSPLPSFYSAYLGSAQRLPNGNTLVCEGSSGRLFEVTSAGSLVWEYINPYTCTYRTDTCSPSVYRARRYSPDYEGLRLL